jgi:hypothetical protein
MPNSSNSHMLKMVENLQPAVPDCRNFQCVTATFAKCQNQNFGRPVMGDRPCQIE